MATVSNWNPYGVAFNVTATAGTITRTSATRFKVVLNVSWSTYWSGNSTNYGMKATSGGVTKVISSFGTSHSSGSASFTGTYSISGTGSQAKSITVTFTNYNDDTSSSSSKNVTLSVSVPAWPTYTIAYNANGGSGAPSSQTKIKGTNLVLSTTKPTRTGYSFKGWGTSSSDTSVDYLPGATYTLDLAKTLYAIWEADRYTVSYNANGGSNAPANQTKTYGVDLTLSSTIPTRSGYEFLGWGVSVSSTESSYNAGGTYSDNKAITLYAVWKVSYWTPKVLNVNVFRCDSTGNHSDYGTYAKVIFDWVTCTETNQSNTLVLVSVDYGSGSPYLESIQETKSTGRFEVIIGDGSLSEDESYQITIIATDSLDGSTTYIKTMETANFLIDFRPKNQNDPNDDFGIAIGKAASIKGLDIRPETIFRSTVEFESDIVSDVKLLNAHGVLGYSSDGRSMLNFVPCNSSDNVVLGKGNYDSSLGATHIYGSNLKLFSKEDFTINDNVGEVMHVVGDTSSANPYISIGYGRSVNAKGDLRLYGNSILINGRTYGVNKSLWSGERMMIASQTINLSEAVSDQPNGIVLVWSYYDATNKVSKNQNWNYHFVPKWHAMNRSGEGIQCLMATASWATIASKYVYVADSSIMGNEYNDDSGTSSSGIKYYNNWYVLRAVLGV